MHENRLQEEIKRRTNQITAINIVASTVGNSLDLSMTLNTALEAAKNAIGAEASGISLIDEEAGEIVLRAQSGWIHDFVETNPMRIPIGQGISSRVILNDETIVYNDMTGNEDFAVPSFREESFRAMAMAPMHARGKIIGILSTMSHTPNVFDQEAISVLTSIADTVGVAIDNARLYEMHVEQENRLKAILHSSADGIIATDQTSRISLVNETAAHMLGIQSTDLISVPVREAPIPVEIRDKLLQALTSDLSSHSLSFQTPLRNVDLSVAVSPVRISSQVTSDYLMDGWVIVLRDITHIRQAEKARVQFIQAAAHDMKNPLSVTQSSIRMIESMLNKTDDSMTEVIGIAKTGIDRLHRLVDNLLQIEKIESGSDFQRDEVHIGEMVAEICAQFKPLMQDNNITFKTDIHDDVPMMLLIDREWIKRAINNLLENAIKYAGNGVIVLRINRENNMVNITVTDNGPGIPESAQSRLFERFFRVNERSDIRGSGLGLAIVKSVAEAHNGRAYVHSIEGQGSTFGLSIPLADNQVAHAR